MTPDADLTLHAMIFRCGWFPRGAVHTFAEPSARREARSEVALAGPDGQRAADLLAAAKRHGTELFAALTERAVRRILAMPAAQRMQATVMFTDDELEQLASMLGGTIATADLLGRSRVRQFVAKREAGSGGVAGQFADPPALPPGSPDDPFDIFPEPIPFQPPAEAVSYFNRLIPSIGTDPYRYGALLERHAFTLAAAADMALLDKVKQAITKKVQGVIGSRIAGDPSASLGTATADVQDILDAAGVSPANPQYAEMVVRTNMMDAYNAGQTAEMARPEMQEFFPVWRYEGILDSRTGDDHRPKINKFYPSAAVFADVRGPRVWNCRCVLPGQFIRGNVTSASKSFYSGKCFEVVTRKVARFAVTANHPVATARGWVAASQLREGDRLFNNSPEIDRLVIGGDVQHRPALVEDVFGAFPKQDAVRIAKRWTALDFHGDGESVNGEVEIVGVAGRLLLELQASSSERFGEQFLGRCHSEHLRLPRSRAISASASTGVGRFHAAESHILRREPRGDGGAGYAVGLAERQHGFASDVPVYDLAGREVRLPAWSLACENLVARNPQPSFKGFRLDADSGRDGANGSPSDMLSGELTEVADLVANEPVAGQATGFRVRSKFQTSAFEQSPYAARRESGAGGHRSDRFPVGVADDEVQEVREFHYEGPVFDFETEEGYYLIGSTGHSMAVVHNCCQTPIYRTEWAELQAKGARLETTW